MLSLMCTGVRSRAGKSDLSAVNAWGPLGNASIELGDIGVLRDILPAEKLRMRLEGLIAGADAVIFCLMADRQ